MRCKDVAARIDLGQIPSTGMERWRFLLHLSLCEACSNYSTITSFLKKVAGEVFPKPTDSAKMNQLNESLLEKFSKTAP